ncbi:hypothetical protein DL98DRAFT_541028 [Cadophora sp. DSE1049]|nr:hypothetical protein DL98DRAFT_541028 [Cadophora sp. DSE1049]
MFETRLKSVSLGFSNESSIKLHGVYFQAYPWYKAMTNAATVSTGADSALLTAHLWRATSGSHVGFSAMFGGHLPVGQPLGEVDDAAALPSVDIMAVLELCGLPWDDCSGVPPPKTSPRFNLLDLRSPGVSLTSASSSSMCLFLFLESALSRSRSTVVQPCAASASIRHSSMTAGSVEKLSFRPQVSTPPTDEFDAPVKVHVVGGGFGCRLPAGAHSLRPLCNSCIRICRIGCEQMI